MSVPKLMYNYRGVYDLAITHEVAYYAGYFTGKYFQEKSGKASPHCLVGNDHRFSSNSLKHYLVQGFIEAGVRVTDVGTLPTSVVSYIIKKHADGGCVVTASHNPPEHNGLKFFDANGGVLKPLVEEDLTQQVLDRLEIAPEIPHKLETIHYVMRDPRDVVAEYCNDVIETIQLAAPLRVATDCRFGTAHVIMPELLSRMSCHAEYIHNHLHPYFLKENGEYLNPEPKEDNIGDISAFIRRGRFDIGLIFDGDSDRNVIVSDTGDYVPDDMVLLMLALEYADRATPVVVTVDTSLMVERELERSGFAIEETPVGDPFVASKLEEGGASFGGVPNGHYIFPGFNLYSDGIYSASVMLRFVSRLKRENQTLSGFLKSLPPTTLLKTKYHFGKTRGEFVEKIAPALKELFSRHCGSIDYLQTDDAVVMGKSETTKLLVRYNRWDNNFNVQAESLESPEKARAIFQEILGELARLSE